MALTANQRAAGVRWFVRQSIRRAKKPATVDYDQVAEALDAADAWLEAKGSLLATNYQSLYRSIAAGTKTRLSAGQVAMLIAAAIMARADVAGTAESKTAG